MGRTGSLWLRSLLIVLLCRFFWYAYRYVHREAIEVYSSLSIFSDEFLLANNAPF